MAENDVIERLSVVLEANAAELVEDTGKAISDLERKLKQMGREADSAFNQAEKAVDKANKSLEKSQAEAEAVKRALEVVGKSGKFAIEQIDEETKELNKALKLLGRTGEFEIKKLKPPVDNVTKAFDFAKTVAASFIGVMVFDKIVSGFQSLIGSIISVGTAAVQSNAQFETFKTQFETLLGSAEAAQQRLDELARFGQQTPFELNEVTAASRVLEVFGGATLATGDNLRMIGDIAAGVNQPFQDVAFWTGRLYDALESGKPFGEAAARLQEMGALSGQTRTRLEDMQKAGADGAEIFAVFSEEVGGKFAGNMERLSATFQGVMSNLVDFRDALIRIGGEPLFEEIRDSAKDFLDLISEEEMNAAILAVAKSAGEAAASLTKIVSSGIIESFEDLDPETLQKFAAALDDFGMALSEAFGGEVKADLNLVIDSLTILIDTGTSITNVFNRFNSSARENQGVIAALKEAFLTLAAPVFQIIEDFKLLNEVVEALTGQRLVDFSRDIADASETTAQAAAKYNQAAEEIANLSAMGPGKQEKPEPIVPVIEIDEEQQKLLDKLDDFAEDFIDATQERNEAIEELEAEHVERVADIEQDAIDDRIDVWEDLNKDLVKLEEDSTQKRIEAAEKYQDALEDLEEDTADKRSDIIRKAKEDLAKVEKSTDSKLKDERQDFNQEEKRDTEDHLNELRQIRERYLMSLEDAVKSRDARAIVDLRRRFEQETAETSRSFETDQSRRREDKDQRLAEIRQEEQERSAEILRNREQELMQLGEQEARKRQKLEESFNEQIAKINEQEARKRAELMARAQEEIATINESEAEKLAAETERFDERQAALDAMLEKRLAAVGKALADEEEMNAESAQKVLESLNEVFGVGGDVDKVMEDFVKRRHQKLVVRMDFEGTTASREEQRSRTTSGGFVTRGRAFASGTGGPRLFSQPTAAIFAEAGPEVVNITPVSQLSKMGGEMGAKEVDLNVRLSGSAPPGINNGADRDALAGVMIEALRSAGFRAKSG